MLKFLTTTAIVTFGSGAVFAQDLELPRQLSWTAYDTGSTGYNQAVAIGKALQDATGTNLRILPGKNDISRTQPLRQGRVEFSATGVGGAFMAQEAVFDFAAEGWGPQPVRVVLGNNGGNIGLTVGVAGDIGVETYSDLKGKRVAMIAGAPGLNLNMETYLAYGGLTLDDVEVVEYGGYGASWTGLIDGDVDAVFGSTNSGQAYEAAASPRGIVWPPIEADNEEGFQRMLALSPFYSRTDITIAAGLDDGGSIPGATYAYPVLVTMEGNATTEVVYNMTKAMDVLFDEYAGAVPGIDGWHIENQDVEWVAPYHEGAIQYFKEAGIWTDAAQANNDKLIERQKVLMEAWAALKEEAPEDWEAAWSQKRRTALQDAGFDVFFE